jgi:hypothetical protein
MPFDFIKISYLRRCFKLKLVKFFDIAKMKFLVTLNVKRMLTGEEAFKLCYVF